MSAEKRSALMSRIKSRNTSPERFLFERLRMEGLSFRRHVHSLPGRPDIVFQAIKVVIFVDGDFWHGWRFPLWRHKLSPKWQQKIQSNRIRDQRNFRALRMAGWRVVRIWEHQIEQNIDAVIKRVITSLSAAQSRFASLAGKRHSRST